MKLALIVSLLASSLTHSCMFAPIALLYTLCPVLHLHKQKENGMHTSSFTSVVLCCA